MDKNKEASRYWNPFLETLPLEQLQQLQLKKFKKLFEFTYQNSKFHRRLY
ncbi:MAG: phenylacetate--CoA ligase, partial [Desulfobacca sp.]|nr:phenylacetate--CoA ligase [Desulfobacca sp.]